MTNYINGLNTNYTNSYKIHNKKPQAQNFCGTTDVEKQKQINEIPSITNDMGVKAPLTYVKTGEKELPYGLKAHFYKLSNGQKVVILPKEGSTVLRSYVNTGSLNEPDNIRGISHYIEHNLFNGSEGLDAGEFFKTTDEIGANTNASTGLAETNYYIESNLLKDTDLEKEIKIHASMLETPKFALDMLEKEKGIVNSEINMITSNPDNIAYNNTLKNLFNIKTSSNDVIAGTTDNITNLTREDVVNYFNNNYYPSNMVTVVSGEVEPEETMKLIAKYFKSNKSQTKPRHFEKLNPITKTVRQDLISDKTNSTYITMGFKGSANNDIKSSIYTTAAANLIFSSSDALRQFKPLNATCESMEEKILSKPDAPKAIMVVADVSEENSEKLLNLIYQRISKYQNNPISDEDLNIIKRDMKKSFTDMFESSFTINDFVGTSILENRIDGINNFEKYIDEMTAKDIQNAAKQYFDLNKTAITVLHPQTSTIEKINENYNTNKNINFTGNINKKAINIDKVKQYDLNNNYRVAIYNSNLPNIHASMALLSEKQINPKNPAAYSVLNEILNNGTKQKTLEEFIRQEEKDGTLIALTTDKSGIVGTFSSNINDYDKAHSLFKELFENPRFTQETFDHAVKCIRDNITRSQKSPMNKLKPELYPNSYTKEEILEGLNSLTLSDVKNLYENLLKNSHGIFAISAPADSNPEISSKILNNINGLQNVQPYKNLIHDDFKPIKETKVLTEVDNKSQAKIVMAYKYKNTGNIKDRAALEIMNYILGGSPSSKLFNDLREKQKLAYSVRSIINRKNTTGIIKLYIGTTTDNKQTGEQSFDNVQKSINGFIYHVNKMKNEKITPEELEKAKLAIKNDILSENERTLEKTHSILAGTGSWYGPDYENKLLKEIDNITIDDIYNTAQNVFGGKPIYSIVATQDTLDFNKNYLENLID